MRWLRAASVWALLAVAGGWVGQRVWWRHSVGNVRQALFHCRPDEALGQLSSLEANDPRDPEILYLLAVAHRRAGRTTRAGEYLERAKQLGWTADDILRQQAMIDFQSGKIADAEPYLLGLINAGCPDAVAVEVYDCLVKGYLADMRLREAMFCLDYWMEWRPEAIEPRLSRAEVFEAMRDTARQVREYEAILAIDPNRVETRLKMGRVLLDQNDANGALEHFQHCHKLAPDAVAVKIALGACYHHLGKLEEANGILCEALSQPLTNAQRAYALLEAGQIALGRREYADAERYLRESLELEPRNATANYALGIVLTRLEQSAAAKQYLDRSQSLRSSFSRYAELMRDITQQPQDAPLRAKAAEVLLQMGDRKLAWSWLMSALRCDRTDVLTHKMFAQYHAEVGDDEMVKRHLAWAKEFSGGVQAAK